MAEQANDLRMTAKETMAVVAAVEDRLGVTPLAEPSDFATDATCGGQGSTKMGHSPNGCMDPGEGASISRVVAVIAHNLQLRAAA